MIIIDPIIYIYLSYIPNHTKLVTITYEYVKFKSPSSSLILRMSLVEFFATQHTLYDLLYECMLLHMDIKYIIRSHAVDRYYVSRRHRVVSEQPRLYSLAGVRA